MNKYEETTSLILKRIEELQCSQVLLLYPDVTQLL